MQLFPQRWVGMSLDDALNLAVQKGYGTFSPTPFTLELSKPKQFHGGRAVLLAIFAFIPFLTYVSVYSLWTRDELIRLTADSTRRVTESSVKRQPQPAIGYVPGIVVVVVVLLAFLYLLRQ